MLCVLGFSFKKLNAIRQYSVMLAYTESHGITKNIGYVVPAYLLLAG